MKKLFIILGALVLLLMAVTAAQAQTYVWLGPDLDGQTFIVHEGQSADMFLGWYTCNRGLANSWMNTFKVELTYADGTLIHQLSDRNDPYWWDIYQWDVADEECITEAPMYSIYWVYPLSLDPGTYEIHFHIWTSHQIPDGYDADYDGVPDLYNIDREGTFTLIFN